MIKAKLRFIDALRGLAILLVLLIHTGQAYIPRKKYPGLAEFTRSGERGVQLFFFVSALTLFLSLDRRKGDERYPIRNYFIRRVARIGPMFWCMMFFCLCWFGLRPENSSFWIGEGRHITWGNILSTATFTNGWNPYWIDAIVLGGWSVAVETMFYVLVPLFFRLIKSIEAAALFVLISAIIAVVFDRLVRSHPMIPDTSLWNSATEFMLPFQLPAFAMGIFCFFFYKGRAAGFQSAGPQIRRRNIARSWLLLAIFAFLWWALPSTGGEYMPPTLMYSIAFMFLVPALAMYENPLLVNPFFTYLGKISYSIYLTHLLLLSSVERAVGMLERQVAVHLHSRLFPVQRWLISLAILLAISVVISTITYWLIEQPGQRAGRWLISRLERHPVPESQLAEAAASL